MEYLDLYRRFAGENLAESDEDSTSDAGSAETTSEEEAAATRPLLGHREISQAGPPGDASNTKSFFTLLKAFMGTGIIFLPKAFRNGGLLFSIITLVTVSLMTSICFSLLLRCKREYGGGYGDIGKRIAGSHLRSLILLSLTISQLGFVCAGITFTAENLLSLAENMPVSNSEFLSIGAIVALQVVLIVPLTFVRRISRLGTVALLANFLILACLAYIYYFDIATIIRRGVEPSVELFNPKSYTLTIGSAVFTFEGIGLLLPIQSSMLRPRCFHRLLYIVMIVITLHFIAVGALSYMTFGDQTKTEVISNFPQSDRLVNALQLSYSLAILVGIPVQLFPALGIMEGKIFGHKSGRRDNLTKWKKNIFRCAIVVLCALIATAGAGNLDKFVALIGSFACIPLVYIYPAYLHWKGVANTRWARSGDCVIMVVGVACMMYTTAVTASVWFGGGRT